MKTKEDFPLGVSGIMRCRDHADFLELCIESCIHALDELVVVYHDSTDGTVGILQQIHKKYPDKVRVYEYPDYLFPISLTREMYEYVARTDEEAPNQFHNYCNFALSKARFRYVVKIDADHICFPKRLKQVCDAYRSTEVQRITEGEISAMNAYRQGKLGANGFSSYMTYILKRIANEKVSVAFSGINVFVDQGELKICLGASDDNNFYPLFNGVHDHFFFTNTGKPQFVKHLSPTIP